MSAITILARTPRALFFRRAFSTTRPTSTAWSTGPAPPRLPKSEQEIYEQLQRQSTGAFSTPQQSTTPSVTRSPPKINQSPDSSTESNDSTYTAKPIAADGKSGEELHPNVRRGAPPEFEGEINPRTGEVGGPKNDPLRWGSAENRGDWSFNGRVTDF